MRIPIALAAISLQPAASDAEKPVAPSLVVEARQADYPADALAAQVEGNVPITLHISPDGQLRCTVDHKTAPLLLRRPSCTLVASRWPFGPNIVKGVAQATEVHLTVAWTISGRSDARSSQFDGATPISQDRWIVTDDYPLEAMRYNREGRVRVSFDITVNGRIANCVVETQNPSRALTNAVCPRATQRALLLPAIGPDGQPRVTKGFLSIVFGLPK